MQTTTYVTPGPPTYPQPPVASALPTSAYVPQPQSSYAYPGGGYALPGNTFAHPVTLQPQLTAQERSQQEAFNREMQAFNQVKNFCTFLLHQEWCCIDNGIQTFPYFL
jgi:hypothetical protein